MIIQMQRTRVQHEECGPGRRVWVASVVLCRHMRQPRQHGQWQPRLWRHVRQCTRACACVPVLCRAPGRRKHCRRAGAGCRCWFRCCRPCCCAAASAPGAGIRRRGRVVDANGARRLRAVRRLLHVLRQGGGHGRRDRADASIRLCHAAAGGWCAGGGSVPGGDVHHGSPEELVPGTSWSRETISSENGGFGEWHAKACLPA